MQFFTLFNCKTVINISTNMRMMNSRITHSENRHSFRATAPGMAKGKPNQLESNPTKFAKQTRQGTLINE